MSTVKQLKMEEQLQSLRDDFETLMEMLSEQENIADFINLTHGKIHNVKSNLFLIDRNRSLKITYLMEQHFDKLRKGLVQLTEDTLELFSLCARWIESDVIGDRDDNEEFEVLLGKLKRLDSAKHPSRLESWNLSSDEKALLRDARNSGLNIFLFEQKEEGRLAELTDAVKKIGMIALQIPFGEKHLNKIVFITDKKQRELGALLKTAVPFDEDLYLSYGDHKILVIEDNPVAQLLQKSIMAEFGVCDTVRDGEEGLELFKLAMKESAPYSIILLDLIMPGMSGEDVLRNIRAEEAAKEIKGLDRCKVIVATGTDDSSVLMNLFRAEADAYIVKPLTRDKILKEMKNLKLN